MPEFWKERWLEGKTGWNLGGPHQAWEFLVSAAFLSHDHAEKARVLVPGCGHGHDGAWFARAGFDTFALDLVDEAIAAAQRLYGDLVQLRLKRADFFELSGQTFHMVADRAMFCAMNPETRKQYVKKIYELIAPVNGVWLLIAFDDIDPELVPHGPPFEVQESEIFDLWQPYGTIEKVWQGRDERSPPAIIRERGYLLRAT